jgi:hypothetical protein
MQELDTGYRPRPQFIKFHKRAQRFSCLVCHRAAGKTVATINDLIDHAKTASIGHYRKRDGKCIKPPSPGAKFAYVGPYRNQAKSVAWDYVRAACNRLAGLGVAINESELRVDFGNGVSLRLFGADNPDAIRGNHFHGLVADEFADWDPTVWPLVVRPTLSSNNGWAVIIGTPRGHNAFYQTWVDAQGKSDWFSMMLKASESGLFKPEELESARESMTEDQYAQEYECNFEAAIQGAYYAKFITAAKEEGRVTGVPYEPSTPVWTAWDLGIEDATAIWFAQVVGREIHLIDYYEQSGSDLGHYVNELRARNYVYAYHLLPHDAQAKELGTGKTRVETLSSLGLNNTRVVPQHRIEDGINAGRLLLPKCWFDGIKTTRGVEALTLYRANVDKHHVDPNTKQPLLQGRPVHDWSSHAADAFRYLAMGIDDKYAGNYFNKKIEYPRLGIA